jgi:ribonuclease G
MSKELIIASSESEVEIALVEDKQLVELHKEKKNHQHVVGDAYLGRVKKIMPGLNAVFVDVAHEKEAFLHYLDLGPQYYSVNKYMRLAMNGDPNAMTLKNFKIEPNIEKTGKISNVLKSGQFILVQIAKEPISTKGPKVTSDISFAGHYLVLVPFSNRISISQKIKSVEERNRLRRLIQSIRPENFGIIVRTNAEGRSVAELDSDLRTLLESWQTMTMNLKKATFPQKLVSELNKTSVLLRDVLTDDFNSIYVDNLDMYNEVKNYIKSIVPEKVDIVKHYKLSTPIFEQFGIQKQIRSSFGRIVSIRSGVYLIIEHTEALHVIDVNSGNHIKAGEGQEDTALQVNMESAVEIARQLRLRDMGGIIIIDFIDMQLPEHRTLLYKKMVEEMAKDKARHTVLPPSKFGLIQITRQRVRPVVDVDVQERCPLCDGTGNIKSSLAIIDEIESNIKYLLTVQNEKHITLVAHPYIYAYLTKGLQSKQIKWFWTYKKWVKIQPSETYNLLEYVFLNKAGDEITL